MNKYQIKKTGKLSNFSCVRVCMRNDHGKIFLFYSKKINVFTFSGGSIKNSETPSEAAVREVKEELGVKLTTFEELAHVKRYSDDGAERNIMVFLATKWDGEISNNEPEKYSNPHWSNEDSSELDPLMRDAFFAALNEEKPIGYQVIIG